MGISTSTLAKKHGLKPQQLFSILESRGYISNSDGLWIPTDEGKSAGAEIAQSNKYGKYIVWPEDFDLSALQDSDIKFESNDTELLSSTDIGKHFGFSANKVNSILSELGWISKGVKGWLVTNQGEKHGGIQEKSYRSGIPYVKWPSTLLKSKVLGNSVESLLGDGTTCQPEEKLTDDIGFREKFVAKHRATDGHYVRSKAEMLIDNFLYMLEIPHAYERRLPIEEEVYSDFYIPTGKVYIEYWGYEDNPKYLARKQAKQEIYKKYGFNLIELSEKEVQNLDDHLPRLLLDFGIQTY